MIKRFFLILSAALWGTMSLAQSYSDRFDQAFNSDDYSAMRTILNDWRADAPDNIDMLIANYNFYVNMIGGETHDASDIVGNQRISSIADSAFAVINHAIELYPNRLDLHLGKIYFLGVLHRWDDFANQIVSTLDHSSLINHRWVFPNIDEGMEDVITDAIEDYQSTMSQAMNDWKQATAADTAMVLRQRLVAKRTVQIFPSDSRALNHLATTYYLFQDYDKAIKYLQRADLINPTSNNILYNLRMAYISIGDKKSAQQIQERIDKL